MNWPPLSTKTSENVAEVLRDAIHKKPKDLLGFVAQALQDKSGLDPTEFERFFEECQRKPRTYVLEDRCPAGQDPLTWVPMRFNDDTILLTLKLRASELTSEILSALPLSDMKGFLDRVCVAFPEFMYVRKSPSEPIDDFGACAPEELAAFQALRALYIGCSRSPDVTLDDESIELSFLCEALAREAKEHLLKPLHDEALLEATIVFIMLRALGSNATFRGRYGGGKPGAEEAALHALENEAAALPSYHRLSEHQKSLIAASLRVFFPAQQLTSAEAAPCQFLRAKDNLVPLEGAMDFYNCTVVVDHMVHCRSFLIRDEAVDAVKLGTHCLASVDKFNAQRAYELYLKKRAEKHSWRIVRDDLQLKAIVRICCLAQLEDSESWNQTLALVEALPEHEKEVLKAELARKDGVSDSPAYILVGASKFMEAAHLNKALGLRPAMLLLARILEDAARHFDHVVNMNQRMVEITFSTLGKRAREYAPGGVPFEDTPFTLVETGPVSATLRMAGDPEV